VRWKTRENPETLEKREAIGRQYSPLLFGTNQENGKMNVDKLRVDSIFLAAIEKPTAEERSAYLDNVCGSDPELRKRVERLVAAQPKVSSFLESPAPALLVAVDELSVSEDPGTVIGPYKLLEQIGEGGFGVVFMAEQTQPVRRKVALKVLKPGMDTRQVVARFEAERQALALMDHPNIAHVYDAGTTASGRPYFVMELVRGIPITEFCDDNHLPVRQRLELFVSACQAVQHAHQKGIIHRDLKPSNLMVTLRDGTPVVKVIDFGIAKALGQQLTDKTLFTNFAQMMGTPIYMSPEQAQLSELDMDTRTDIYSLGVLLYELLTSTTPCDKERLRTVAYDEIRRIIREEEPARPSLRVNTLGHASTPMSAKRGSDPVRLSQLFRGELDWIVMKALEKDRNRRYESASAFAADVQRYLADEPVLACPPSAGYRLKKLARRYKGVLTAAMLIAIALVIGTVVSAWQAIRATRAETLAKERLEGEQQQRTLAQNNAADANARRGEAETARQEAIANLQQARQAVDQMLTRVAEEKLFNTPQMEMLRKGLLEDALKFYQRFLLQDGSDPAVRLGAAEAYRRTGQIYTELGQPDRAEPAQQKAIELLEKLVTDSPTDPANRLALALSYYQLGGALERLGRYPESESALRRAIGLMQALMADFPKHDGYPRIMAPMNGDLARVSERLVQVSETLKTEKSCREHLRLQEKLLAAAPNDPHRRHAVACAQLQVGETLFRDRRHEVACAQIQVGETLFRDRPQEAERLFRDAIAGNMKLTSEFPHTTQYSMDLADANHHLFLLLRDSRRFKEAEPVYRESLTHLEKLIAEAPTLPYARRLLVEHHWDYALMLEDARRPQDAEKALQQAITGAEAMRTEFPSDAWASARLACVHNHVGNKHQIEGRFAEAEAAFRKALDLSEKSVRALPHAELRYRLGDSCVNLGLLLMMRGRQEEAIRIFRNLLEVEPISPITCNNVAWRLAIEPDPKLRPPGIALEFARKGVALAAEDGKAWNTLGVAQLRAENWEESIKGLQKSMELRKGGDSCDWFFLAMAHWHLGNKDEARRWFDQGVGWMDKNQPENEELQRFRAEAAELLGLKDKKD
jgi:serine/threonine protein kinase/Flp pilus assembly protein TadD